MDKEHLQIIGELYTEAHRMRFLLQQGQGQQQALEQKLTEAQSQIQALEQELAKAQATIQEFKSVAGQEQENDS